MDPQFSSKTLLKKDTFSLVERGVFDNKESVLRRIDQTPWYAYPLAKLLLKLEARSLSKLQSPDLYPPLFFQNEWSLIRGWIDGLPMHLAKPINDSHYFSSAFLALRQLHRLNICHNDLAKEQNWLKGKKGQAIIIDFQLAYPFKNRGFLFRILAREDLRHYLKHKQKYLPTYLTPIEKKILSKKSLFAKLYRLTFKQVYLIVTRGIFHTSDREGEGSQQMTTKITHFLQTDLKIKDSVIVPYPHRKKKSALYAFIVSSNPDIPLLLTKKFKSNAPSQIQLIPRLPLQNTTEILKLIAANQIDQIDPLVSPSDQSLITSILSNRKNLSDRK